MLRASYSCEPEELPSLEPIGGGLGVPEDSKFKLRMSSWTKEDWEYWPQLAEALVLGDVSSPTVTASRSGRSNREKSKNGTFYTPPDVADFLSESVVCAWLGRRDAHGSGAPRVLDPACGTGVLLRGVCNALATRVPLNTRELRLQYVAGCVTGIDLDDRALDAAATTLLEWILRGDGKLPVNLEKAWGDVRRRLLRGSAHEILGSGAPSLFHAQSFQVSDTNKRVTFDLLIQNPPYATVCRHTGTRNSLAWVPFVRLMWRVLKKDGAAIAVLPLSLSYNSSRSACDLRAEMRASRGSWKLSFYDRAPDSIFGDGVKTRACIALFENIGFENNADSGRIETTRLHRWSRTDRASLFRTLQFTTQQQRVSPGSCFKKLGSSIEVEIISALERHRGAFGRSVDGMGRSEMALAVAPTAYNFIGVRPILKGFKLSATTSEWSVCLESEQALWKAYAALSASLTFWLWLVEEDGFHVRRGFINSLPLDLRTLPDGLIGLGRELYDASARVPVVAVNRGITTTRYATPIGEQLEDIDVTIGNTLSLTDRHVQFLREYRISTILAGRVRSQRNEHHFRTHQNAREA